LNIRAGSHPSREGTRLNGCCRKPCRGGPGVVEAGVGHCTSECWSNAHAAAGQSCPVTVKLCERYRDRGQGSILSALTNVLHRGARTEGEEPPSGRRTHQGGVGLTRGKGFKVASCLGSRRQTRDDRGQTSPVAAPH